MTEVCSLCYDPITGLPNYTKTNQALCQACTRDLANNPELAPVDISYKVATTNQLLPLPEVLNLLLGDICQTINIAITNQVSYLTSSINRIKTITNWQKLAYPTSGNLYQKDLADKLELISIEQDGIRRNQSIFGRVCGQIVDNDLTDLTGKLNQLYRLKTYAQTLGPLDDNYFLSVLPSGKFQQLSFTCYLTGARTFSTTYDNKLFYYNGTNLYYKYRKNGQVETVQVNIPADYHILDVNTNGIWYQRTLQGQREKDVICTDLDDRVVLNIPKNKTATTNAMFNDTYLIIFNDSGVAHVLQKIVDANLQVLRRLLAVKYPVLTDTYLFYLKLDENRFTLVAHALATGQEQNVFISEPFNYVHDDTDLADFNLADGLVHCLYYETPDSENPVYKVYDFTGQKLLETIIGSNQTYQEVDYDPDDKINSVKITINPETGKVYLFKG